MQTSIIYTPTHQHTHTYTHPHTHTYTHTYIQFGFIIYSAKTSTYQANGCYADKLAYATDINKHKMSELMSMTSFKDKADIKHALYLAFNLFTNDTLRLSTNRGQYRVSYERILLV